MFSEDLPGRKHAPGQPAKDLTRQQCFDVLGEEGHENGGAKEAQSRDDGPLLSEVVHNPAVEDGPEESSYSRTIANGSLPLGLQLIARARAVADSHPTAVLLLCYGQQPRPHVNGLGETDETQERHRTIQVSRLNLSNILKNSRCQSGYCTCISTI